MNQENKLTIEQQENLLKQSIEHKIPFSQILQQNGMTYDSLRYVNNFAIDDSCLQLVQTLDDIEKSTDGIPAVSFFSGAGGLDIGFSYAGFNNLISIEFN